MNRFNTAPHKNQLKAVVWIFSYIQESPVCQIRMDLQDFDLVKESGKESSRLYPDVCEELDSKKLESFENLLLIGMIYDSDHAQKRSSIGHALVR